MREPEVTTTSQKLDKLIKRIDDGDIKVPAFQRGYVWKQDQIIDLLESVISEFPIGSILLWEASAEDKLKSTRNIAGYRIPDRPDSYPVNYVLDGQQRLSTIYAVFSEAVRQDIASLRYNPDHNLFELYYDLEKQMFATVSECDPQSPSVVYLRNLLNPLKLFDELARIDRIHHVHAKELSSKFLNYDLPVVTIKNRRRTDVGLIFERINNTGTKLDTIDLMTAWTWTEDFHLLEAANDLSEELEEKGFGNLHHKLLLQIVSGILIESTRTENILKLSGEQVRDGWEKVCESLRRAVDFLSTSLGCRHIDFLPYNQQLVSLAKFFSVADRPAADSLGLLKVWFWRTSFSDRYSTGQTTSKMDADLQGMRAIASGDRPALDRYSYSVNVAELTGTQFSKTNPLTRAFLLLMAQHGPRDLVKNSQVDLSEALSSFNRKQYHHVFPNAFLNARKVVKGKRFSLMNFCFLPADSNKQISRKEPAKYFVELIPQDHFTEILNSNLLPLKRDIYQQNDYDGFLELRAQLVMGAIDQVA